MQNMNSAIIAITILSLALGSFSNSYAEGIRCPEGFEPKEINDNITMCVLIEELVEPKKRGGGGCADCTPPTLGYNSNGVKKVDNGVCINNSCMDGSYFHTEYLMQNTLLYFPNTISLKYYDNGGPSNIQMAQLGLGVYEIGTPLSESQVIIEVWLYPFKNDIYNPSIKEIILTDKDEILSWYDATIKLVPCMTAHSANNCLEFNFKFGYAKPPISPIIVSQAWDVQRNTINNYIDDGLNVIYYTSASSPN